MKKVHLVRVLVLLLAVFALSQIVVAQDDWWATAGKPYAGVTLHGVSESTPPSNFAKDVLAPKFEELTGIKVEFETTSWDEMYNKAINDMAAGTGIYDFVYIEQDIVYAYLAQDFLVDVTQSLADKPELASPDFSFDKFSTFINYFKNADGHVFGIPMEAFIKTYLYRTDLFNDPEIKAAFEAQYGYPLAPATTHEQYTQIAEFFNQWGKDHPVDGEQVLWGTAVQAANGHPASWYEFFESIAPTYGIYNWGINMENWKATVENGGSMNSDVAKEALAWWVNNLQYAPPESTQSTWDEVAATFAAGRVAQGWVYGENITWIATNADKSKVVGNVAAALPPLADGVMEQAEAGDGYIGYYDGGAFGIPHSSKNKEAALLWLQFIGQESVQADWAVAGGRVVMNSTFEDPLVQEFDKATQGYFTLLKDDGYLFAGAPPFPFHAQVREATAPIYYKVITGELTPSDALDQMAAATDAELVQLGYGQ